MAEVRQIMRQLHRVIEGFPIVMEQFRLLRNVVSRHVTAVKPSWLGVSAS